MRRGVAGMLAFLVTLFALGLACCTDSSSSSDALPLATNTASVDGLIGPEGGTLTHPAGAKLVVSPGALAAPTRLTLTGVAAPSTDVLGGVALGQG